MFKHDGTFRIVVTGSHSVGKSSLVRDLNQALQKRGIRSTVAEEPIRKLSGRLHELDELSRYLLLTEVHFARLGARDACCCIYDRSLLDLLVYARLEGPKNPRFQGMLEEQLKWYARFIDLFLYLPIEIPLEPDRRRPSDENYRIRVDEEIKNVAEGAGIQMILIRGSRPERTTKALDCCLKMIAKAPDEPQ
jgi:nicotinamide riboside kinase